MQKNIRGAQTRCVCVCCNLDLQVLYIQHSPTSRNWALTLNSGAWNPPSCASVLLLWIPSNSWWTARGMMPCSCWLRLMSKPVPMVYVFPEPVWKTIHRHRELWTGFSQHWHLLVLPRRSRRHDCSWQTAYVSATLCTHLEYKTWILQYQQY